MKPVYEIKFLSSADFDKLPVTETNGSDISDSLGFYNPYTNRVFIRHSAYPELNKYLLDHEFEHLVEETATDADENGIRHKKKSGFAKLLQVFYDPMNLGYLGTKDTSKGLLYTANKKPESQAPQNPFGGMGISNQSQSQGTPSFGSSTSPFSDQQSSQSGLNQGLNQQTVNPLADPYAKYGQQQGRLYF